MCRVRRPARLKRASVAAAKAVKAPAAVVEQESPQVVQIRNWHFDQLERLGYTASEAAVLELSGVDVQLLRSLVADGCSLALAALIAT